MRILFLYLIRSIMSPGKNLRGDGGVPSSRRREGFLDGGGEQVHSNIDLVGGVYQRVVVNSVNQ